MFYPKRPKDEMGKRLTTEAQRTQRYVFFVCRETPEESASPACHCEARAGRHSTGQAAANENRCSAFGGMRFLVIKVKARYRVCATKTSVVVIKYDFETGGSIKR